MNLSTADAVLPRLDGVVERGGNRWYAQCPAHDDKSPSLSIAVGDDGRLLLHCFAGCSAEDVLLALELRWSDIYPDRGVASYRAATASKGRRFTDRLMRVVDPLEVDRAVLRVAASDLREGKVLSTEDRARVEVARQRLSAAKGEAS